LFKQLIRDSGTGKNGSISIFWRVALKRLSPRILSMKAYKKTDGKIKCGQLMPIFTFHACILPFSTIYLLLFANHLKCTGQKYPIGRYSV
jgi:hypothetical protein